MKYLYCIGFCKIPFKECDIIVYPMVNDMSVISYSEYELNGLIHTPFNLVYWIKGELYHFYFKSDLYYLGELVSCGVIGNDLNDMLEKHFKILFGYV